MQWTAVPAISVDTSEPRTIPCNGCRPSPSGSGGTFENSTAVESKKNLVGGSKQERPAARVVPSGAQNAACRFPPTICSRESIVVLGNSIFTKRFRYLRTETPASPDRNCATTMARYPDPFPTRLRQYLYFLGCQYTGPMLARQEKCFHTHHTLPLDIPMNEHPTDDFRRERSVLPFRYPAPSEAPQVVIESNPTLFRYSGTRALESGSRWRPDMSVNLRAIRA